MSPPTVRRTVHPIEAESYRILRARVDTTGLLPWTRAVVERVVHSSADLDYVDDLVCHEPDLQRAAAELAAGAPIVTDAEMVAAGITRRETYCFVRDPRTREAAAAGGTTRSAAAVRVALADIGPGAVWVVGNAPTALYALLDLAAEARPSLIVGLPVGFVGAMESKQALRESGLPSVTNRSEKGGSAVAAATVNALLYGSNA
ncbi:MAG TPA: precorrin-8X methylmutase [Nocardioidaceae bacterium]|nr:precorrin-8X methylmutase [Nocardioidaceae bacterium]